MSTRTKGELEILRINNLVFLPHPNEPPDKYESYISSGVAPSKRLTNKRNFFDDSNTEDRKWLNIAREFIEKLK